VKSFFDVARTLTPVLLLPFFLSVCVYRKINVSDHPGSLFAFPLRLTLLPALLFLCFRGADLASSLAGFGVENRIMAAILDKLRERIRAKAVFRVIFLLPQPEETGDAAMSILSFMYRSINRGGTSLLEQLSKEFPGINLEQWVGFFFLRAHGTVPHPSDAKAGAVPVTEKVFVHSKLMVVDDRIAIVSSANLVRLILSPSARSS
jgi:hypothetical protein